MVFACSTCTTFHRYSNGFASGKLANYFTETHACEGPHAADWVIRFCESYLPESR